MQEIKNYEFCIASIGIKCGPNFVGICPVIFKLCLSTDRHQFEDVIIGNDIIMATEGITNATMVTETLVSKVAVVAV
jgi:hypothetical protein